MVWFEACAYYARMAWGLRETIREPTHPDPVAVLSEQLANRERRFLDMLAQVVFADPQHPYAQMFDEARCSFADVEHLVRSCGIERALETLRQQGVCLSHDEFKGHQPIIRNGRHIPANARSFRNPLASARLESSSAGGRSRGTRVGTSPRLRAYQNCSESLAFTDLDAWSRSWFILAPMLPSAYGFTRSFFGHKLGLPAERWYAVAGTFKDSGHYRAVTRLLWMEARAMGVRMPPLRFLPQNDFSPVAEEIAQARRRGRLSLVTGVASSCVRVAAAALDRGLDISGARFVTSGEALTPAKAAVIRSAGAEAFATYKIAELGTIGLGCSKYGGLNTVHHFRDAVAMIARPSKAPDSEIEVNSMLFTSLLPFSPSFVINLEIGDHGVMARAQCDCAFSKLGFTNVISDIYSYSKLTSHGMTLPAASIVAILEGVLPARFGGSPLDYQLVEQDAGDGTRIALRVNPGIGEIRPDQIRECFLGEVRKLYGGALANRIWRHAGSLEILAEPPIVGRTGKIPPLVLLGLRKPWPAASGVVDAS